MPTGVSGDRRPNTASRAEQANQADPKNTMNAPRRAIRNALLATALAVPLAALGCELLLGIEDIELGTPPDSCWIPTGNGGRGCYRAGETGCPIQSDDPVETHNRIINACTTAACIPFTTELTKLGGSTTLPPLPAAGGDGGSGGSGGMGGSGGSGGMGGSCGMGGDGGMGGSGGMGGDGGMGGGQGGSGGGAPLEMCSQVIDPALPRIYMAGSNAVVRLLQKAAPILSGPTAEKPVVIIYQPLSSCDGFETIAFNEPIKGEASYFVEPSQGQDTGERPCQLDSKETSVDIGTCDVFAGTCITSVLSSDVADYGSGPIQAMTLVVPATSDQKVLSREAAYLIYGFGAQSEVAPFTDEARILQRNDESGTKRMIAPAIDVPYDRWKGKLLGSTSVMKAELAAANKEGGSAASATLGILDVTNDGKGEKEYLKILAFQGKGQTCGFWPDSEPDNDDMKNVRDGHYVIWGPLHFFVRASNKNPTNPLATAVVNYLTGFRPLPNEKFAFTMVGLQATGGLIPRCAMRVDRTTELGDLKPYSADFPCGCYFEQVVTGEAKGCKPCSSNADCDASSEVCSFDFCERK